jgi:hypothetical protein
MDNRPIKCSYSLAVTILRDTICCVYVLLCSCACGKDRLPWVSAFEGRASASWKEQVYATAPGLPSAGHTLCGVIADIFRVSPPEGHFETNLTVVRELPKSEKQLCRRSNKSLKDFQEFNVKRFANLHRKKFPSSCKTLSVELFEDDPKAPTATTADSMQEPQVNMCEPRVTCANTLDVQTSLLQ